MLFLSIKFVDCESTNLIYIVIFLRMQKRIYRKNGRSSEKANRCLQKTEKTILKPTTGN